MRLSSLIVIVALSIATNQLRSANAALVDYSKIDIEGSDGRLEPGWVTLPGAPLGIPNNVNNTNLATQNLVSDTADPFTIAISNLNSLNVAVGAIDWRDRGDATTPQTLARMAEDFIKNNAGIVRVTLGSLPAGNYEATSYHIDASNRQSNSIKVNISTDGGVTFAPPAADIGSADFAYGGVNGAAFSTANISDPNLTSTFTFTSNGTDNVVLIFDGIGGMSGAPPVADIETTLSGLAISTVVEVPEPSTLALAVLGLASAGFFVRRRLV